jgi:hypothetical protein
MFCSNCGQPVSTGQPFCSSCGSAQRIEQGTRAIPNAYSFSPKGEHQLLQVGGGILFFCVIQVVFGAVLLFNHHSGTPMENWLSRLFTLFGIVVAIFLAFRMNYALDLLKTYLFTSMLFNSIVIFQHFSAPNAGFGNLDTGLPFRQIVIATIWFLYFRNSLRVKATYGRNI